ncbi:hypothetical protein ACFT8W_11925 [Streptomyces hygroscopicus]|uniref:hypothetical protein n=1 Tax=Streptomyces hygroscopicus TaxID=1912 RepID=UPI003626B173
MPRRPGRPGRRPLRPPGRRRVRLSGRYGVGVPAAGALRPLRDPDAPELDEDDDSEE